jgi:hypothetical protein
MARWFLHHVGIVIQERTAGENLLSHAPGDAQSRHCNQRWAPKLSCSRVLTAHAIRAVLWAMPK